MDTVEKIVDDIITTIYSSPNRNGAIIPSETTLSTKYGTSRSTVREALKILQYFHIIKSTKGSGYTVTLDSSTTFALTAQKLLNLYHFSYEEVSMLRQALEIQIVSLIKQRGFKEEEANFLKQCVEDMRDGKEAAIEADIKFHKYLASLVDNSLLIAITETTSLYTKRNIQAFWNSTLPYHEKSIKEMVDAHEGIIEDLLKPEVPKINANSIVNHYTKSNMFIPAANRYAGRTNSPEQTQILHQIKEWLEFGLSPDDITAFAVEGQLELEKQRNTPAPIL